MKTLTLPLHQMRSPQEVLALLAKENLRKGDRLDVVVPNKEEQENGLALLGILLFLGAVLLLYFHGKQEKEKRVAEGGQMLDDLLAKGNAVAVEQELEAEYGIEIEFIGDGFTEEEGDWNRLARQNLATAYEDDEPDYSDVMVKEHNPDYKSS